MNREWKEQQNEDETITENVKLWKDKETSQWKVCSEVSKEIKTVLRHKHRFILRNGLLYKKIQFGSKDKSLLQFVLPTNYRSQAIKVCNDDIVHQGLQRSLDLLKDRFYWPGMNDEMENHNQKCERYLHYKSKPQKKKTELCPITATHPLELVHMDFLTIQLGKTDKDVNILIITDHFTWYAQTFVTPSQTAWVVAESL